MHQPTCTAAIFAILAASCGESAPENSMLLSLRYDDALGLDTVEMILGAHTDTAPIAHQVMLLMPDDADSFPSLEVWGRKAGKRAA